MAKHDPILKEQIEYGRKNAKYTSKTTQNELINIIGKQIRQNLTSCLEKEDAFFAIIADELTDQFTNQEMLTVCLRFLVCDGKLPSITEVFFDFVSLERTTGQKIAEGIMESLRKYGIDILKCRGQAYDGAACMSSEAKRVQGQLKRVATRALYTHCKSHALNLSITASCKDPPIRNMIDTVNAIFLFFDNSGKRQRFFERVLDRRNPTSSKHKLLGLCKTRWVERHTCYETLYELYEFVCICLDAIVTPGEEAINDLYDEGETWSWDRETRIKGQGLLYTLRSFGFIVAFLVAKDTLQCMKVIASKLQKSDLDVYEAYTMIDDVSSRLRRFRENVESEFKETYATAVSLSGKVGGTVTIPRITQRQVHRSNVPGENPECYYRKNIQIPFLDHLTTQMATRFQDRTCSDIFTLVPGVIDKMSDIALSDCSEKLMFWRDDLPTPSSLKAELKEWRHKWKSEENGPKNLIHCLHQTDPDMYPNIRTLLRIACTLPVGSAGAERSFSCYRRTKTYLRNRTGDERLSGLCLMNMHPHINIDVELVIKEFWQRTNGE